MPHPKVKISDDSGNAVSVTDNRLNVNAYLSATPTIDIGDVSLLLGGTAASTNVGVNTDQTLRVTLATDDTHFGEVGAAADKEEGVHAQLHYIANSFLDLATQNTLANVYTATGHALVQTGDQYSEGDYNTTAIVRNDILASLVTSDNDYAPLQVNAEGALYTTGNTLQGGVLHGENFTVMGESKVIDGSALPNSVAEGRNSRITVSRTGIQYTHLTNDVGTHSAILEEDAAHSSGDYGIMSLAVRSNTLGSLVGSDNDYAPLQVNTDGALYVEATLSTTDNNVLDAMVVDLAAMEALLITIDSDTDAIKTASQILDNVVHVDDAGFTLGTDSGVMMMGFAGTQSVNANDAAALACSTAGALKVDLSSSGVITINAIEEDVSIADGGNSITVDNGGTFAVQSTLQAGSAAIGKLAANSGVDIGDVDVTSISAGTNAIGKVGHDITGMVSDRNTAVSDTTAEQLNGATDDSYDQACKRVDLQAATINTGYILVGDDGLAANLSGGGIKLNPGDFYSMDVNNVGNIYVLAETDGEDIYYTYFT
jgi:hypothetical protein